VPLSFSVFSVLADLFGVVLVGLVADRFYPGSLVKVSLILYLLETVVKCVVRERERGLRSVAYQLTIHLGAGLAILALAMYPVFSWLVAANLFNAAILLTSAGGFFCGFMDLRKKAPKEG